MKDDGIECPYCHAMFSCKDQHSELGPKRDVADLLKIAVELKKRAERAEVSERGAWGYVARLKKEKDMVWRRVKWLEECIEYWKRQGDLTKKEVKEISKKYKILKDNHDC